MSDNSKPKVYIIILNWNRLNDILECLKSVYEMDYENFQVVVVDNGSIDGSCAIIQRQYPRALLIKNSHNLGFAGGNNVGMQYAINQGADYIWLLNNDVVLDHDCLHQMIMVGESSPSVGLLSPIVYDYDNPSVWQFAGGYINHKTLSVIHPNKSQEVSSEYQTGRNVVLWGTALLLKRNLATKIGCLKEEYFAYWEDIEYSLRALNSGFTNSVCDKARVYHKNKIGLGRNQIYYYFNARNRFLFGMDYLKGARSRLGFYRRFFAEMLMIAGSLSRNKEFKNLEALLDGAWHGIRSISGPMLDGRRMPKIIVNIFLLLSTLHPFLLANLIMFDFGGIYGDIRKKAPWITDVRLFIRRTLR